MPLTTSCMAGSLLCCVGASTRWDNWCHFFTQKNIWWLWNMHLLCLSASSHKISFEIMMLVKKDVNFAKPHKTLLSRSNFLLKLALGSSGGLITISANCIAWMWLLMTYHYTSRLVHLPALIREAPFLVDGGNRDLQLVKVQKVRDCRMLSPKWDKPQMGHLYHNPLPKTWWSL